MVREKRKEIITTANIGYIHKDVKIMNMSTQVRKAVLVIENICGPRRHSVNPLEKMAFSDTVFEK